MPVPSRLGNPLVRLHHNFLFSSTQRRYLAHYGVDLGKQVAKKDGAAAVAAPAEVKKSNSVIKRAAVAAKSRVLDKVTSPLTLNLLCLSFFSPYFFVVLFLASLFQWHLSQPPITSNSSSPPSVCRGAIQEWPPLRAHQLTARPERTLRWVRLQSWSSNDPLFAHGSSQVHSGGARA